MLLIVPASLVLIFSIFANSLLKPPTRPAALLGLYLLSFANVVLVSEVAGTVHLLNSRVFFLGSHLVLAGLAWFAWQRTGRPSLLGPFSNATAGFTRRSLWTSLKSQPELWLLAMGVTIAYLVGAGLVLKVAPTTGIV